jgi:CBS domain containing-hemolysin-like protein
LGTVPKEGHLEVYDNLTFRVLRMKGTRILEIEVRRRS